MQILDVMTPHVQCVRPTDTVLFAAERMRDLDVGALPVCGDGQRLIGMLSDRDITIRATASALDPVTTTVDKIMTPDLVYCFEDDDISEAARIMETHQIRRIVVLNRNKQLAGIVSLGDIAVKLGDDLLSGEVLEQVSEPVGFTA